MPIKRRQPKARSRVTAEAVAAFARGDWLGLHAALGLKPWDSSPLDVDHGPPPVWHDPDAWAKALALRVELEAALKARA